MTYVEVDIDVTNVFERLTIEEVVEEVNFDDLIKYLSEKRTSDLLRSLASVSAKIHPVLRAYIVGELSLAQVLVIDSILDRMKDQVMPAGKHGVVLNERMGQTGIGGTILDGLDLIMPGIKEQQIQIESRQAAEAEAEAKARQAAEAKAEARRAAKAEAAQASSKK